MWGCTYCGARSNNPKSSVPIGHPSASGTDNKHVWVWSDTQSKMRALVVGLAVLGSIPIIPAKAQYWPPGPRTDMPIPQPPNCTRNASGNFTCCDDRRCWTVYR